MSLTPRAAKSGARRATSPSSVVQTWETGIGDEIGQSSQSNAYGCEVCRVGEKNSPRVADPLVERLHPTCCGLSFEIGGDRTEAERWHLGRVDDEGDEPKWV
jgi:hypothetical protein